MPQTTISITPVLYSRPTSKGLYYVKIRITRNRKSEFLNLGFSIRKDHWNTEKKRVKSACPKYKEYNAKIKGELEKLEAQWKKDNNVGLDKSLLLPYIEKLMQDLEKGKQYSTCKRYRTVYLHLKEFTKESKIHFYHIDKEFISNFTYYLSNFISSNSLEKIPSNNTIINYLRTLKTILSKAKEDGLFHGEIPINKKNIPPKSKGLKKTLQVKELWKLDNAPIDQAGFTQSLWDSLNIFLFCFWSQGLRCGDALALRWGYIENGKLIVRMEKTDHQIAIPLNSESVQRIKWYLPEELFKPYWCWRSRRYLFEDDGYETGFLEEYEAQYHEWHERRQEEKESVSWTDYIEDTNLNEVNYVLDTKTYEFEQYFRKKNPSYDEIIDRHHQYRTKHLLMNIDLASKNSGLRNQFIFPFLRGLEDCKDRKKVFNRIGSAEALINKNLKKIAAILGISPFSTHYARHTLADMSKKTGTDIYEISKYLGHTRVTQTQTYLSNIIDERFLETVKDIRKLL